MTVKTKIALALLASSISAAHASELLITEVVEGSSNNKAVEITNISANPVDLSGYNLAFFFNNNSTVGTNIDLTAGGILAPGQVFVVADNDANAGILAVADLTSNRTFFNGDDSIALRQGTTIIDVMGQIGQDPGSQWGSGLTSTQNNTIVRNANVTTGDTDGTDAFDPSLEWTGFEQDYIADLGMHNGSTGGGVDTSVCTNCPTLDKVADASAFDATSYYAAVQTEIDANSSIAVIKQVLSQTISDGQKNLTYSEVWTALTETDEDPTNTDNIVLFYSGWSIPKANNGSGAASSNGDFWNREHSWPSSHGFGSQSFEAYTDIHHLRPTDITINSSRGNLDFDNSDSPLSEAPENRIDSDSFEPRDAVKGDVARMMLYMDTRYEGVSDSTPDLVLVDRLTSTQEAALGKLCTLLAWHAADPVDQIETDRHSAIYEYQGNRNPFIDNPSWVEMLYPAASCSSTGGGDTGGGDTGGGDTGGGDTGGDPAPAADIRPLMISGVIDGPLSGGVPKAIEIFVAADTSLEGCGFGSANNGGGSDGEEFSFPALDATAGSYIYVASESTGFQNFLGFAPDFTTSAAGINGDDAIELFCNGEVIDVFGDIDTDGSGQPWEYLDGWAYRSAGKGPSTSFTVADWQYSGRNQLDGESSNASAEVPFPLGTHSYDAPELFFSEYVEGGSNNKALEIYNPSIIPVDLSVYDVQMFVNGGTSTFRTIGLEGSVAAGDVFVLINSSSDLAELISEADQTTGSLTFNGDDAITLRNNGVLVDSIGKIGEDPGSQWGSGEQSTQNNTLRRKVSVMQGDLDATDDFDPAVEWDGFAQDTVDNIGIYGAGSNSGGGTGGDLVLGACGDSATLISAIQGNSVASPLANETHVIEAVVTGVFPELTGFFVQQATDDGDSATSEGVFVRYEALGAMPQAGDVVRVIGTVEESFNKTQLTATEAFVACGTRSVAATVLPLPLPAEFDLETIEGMLVSNAQTLTISDNGNYARFGEVTVSSQRLYTPTHVEVPGSPEALALAEENALNRLTLDDDRDGTPVNYPFGPFDPNAPLRIGTQIAGFDGIMDYSFNRYRVRPLQISAIVAENVRDSAPVIASGNLTIASFNVLNLFNGDGLEGGFPTSRGADNFVEYERQLAKIVAALVAMDADVVGLMEIENDGFGPNSAIAQLTDALNTELGETVYAFIAQEGPVGTDVITVGMLYKTTTVTPSGNSNILTTENSIADEDGPLFVVEFRNRPSLAQLFTLNENGAEVVVNVNHFKSKGGSCGTGDDSTNGQGSCNLTRTRAATAVAAWLDATYGDKPIVIVGDLNAYAKEDPIVALQGAGYTDVARELEGPLAYSYEFSGQFGSLDYAMANAAAMEAVVDIEEWHINSDEPDAFDYDEIFSNSSTVKPAAFANELAFRASDHDPVVMTMDLQAAAVIGDFDGDGDVDMMDYRGLLMAIRTRQAIDMSFDLNGDGRISTFDARVLVSLCTRPRCAI